MNTQPLQGKKTSNPFWGICFVLAMTVSLGCAQRIHAGKPFTDAERLFFDDGIDVVADYSGLQGTYGFEAREELDGRSNLADVIGKVTILSVQSNQGSGGEEQLLLEVRIDQLYYGKMDTKQIVLSSSSNSLGYTLLKRHESAITGSKLLFLRTFEPGEGAERAGHHFHLSADSPALTREVQRYVQKRLDAENGDREE